MQQYLDRPVKAIIDEFPAVADVLEDHGIGCVPCSVGSCLLKDVVSIHNLSEEAERDLLTRVAAIIYPGRDVDIPAIPRDRPAGGVERSYSPPIRKLVDEHVLIKRVVACVPGLVETVDVASEDDRRLVADTVDFITNYADRYHHAKEEDVLFTYFDADLEILQVMHEDHEGARAHVRAILAALENRDGDAVKDHLAAWHDLLTQHIRKEDEILYPWMDRLLSMTQVGTLFAAFQQTDAEFGDAPQRHKTFVETLEQTLVRRLHHA